MSKPRVYGQWAGCPNGIPENVTRCIAEVADGGRSPLSHQCDKKRKPGSDYCGTHDPVNVQARRDKAQAKYEAKLAAPPHRVIEQLRAALAAAEANLATFGMVELAVRNPNVSSYITEWEGRALRAESALADERRHADALKEGLAACVGERATFYAGQTQTVTWAVAIEHAERLLSEHRARRAHDSECESEFDSQVHAHTPCGCAARARSEGGKA